MNRSPLKRGAPLRNTTPLRRYTGLRQVSAKRANEPKARPRRKPAAPRDVREVLLERSQGWCEIAAPGCQLRGIDPAHRKGSKAGGRKGAAADRHNVPSNYLWACRACHDFCHSEPAEAERKGWMLREHQDPLTEPVLYRGEPKFLDDEGRTYDFEAAA